jgi:hypothetical protein
MTIGYRSEGAGGLWCTILASCRGDICVKSVVSDDIVLVEGEDLNVDVLFSFRCCGRKRLALSSCRLISNFGIWALLS